MAVKLCVVAGVPVLFGVAFVTTLASQAVSHGLSVEAKVLAGLFSSGTLIALGWLFKLQGDVAANRATLVSHERAMTAHEKASDERTELLRSEIINLRLAVDRIPDRISESMSKVASQTGVAVGKVELWLERVDSRVRDLERGEK